MKYHFMILQEAEESTYKYFQNICKKRPFLLKDYYVWLVAMTLAKFEDKTSYGDVLAEYNNLGGRNGGFYDSNVIKPIMDSTVKVYMTYMPKAKNEKDAIKNALYIEDSDKSKYRILDFFSIFNDEIKRNTSSPDKVAFVYKCYVGGKIPQKAQEDNTWKEQIYNTSSNYRMSNRDFMEVFCAYTLAFNYPKVNPNELFITSNHFVTALQANARYQEIKSANGNDSGDDDYDWIIPRGGNRAIIYYLVKRINPEGYEGTLNLGRDDVVDSAMDSMVGAWLYGEAKAPMRRRGYDINEGELRLPSNCNKIKISDLRDILANSKFYKEHFDQ